MAGVGAYRNTAPAAYLANAKWRRLIRRLSFNYLPLAVWITAPAAGATRSAESVYSGSRQPWSRRCAT
ncbi:hypothetical protein KCP70_17410 [Salmonella enterica subsp. enterica]|nr:hypothetical protein KCP70_17410 [Salmonella enterica subsp. enterica]